MRIAIVLAALLYCAASLPAQSIDSQEIAAVLRAKDQELLNAVTAGDPKAWDATLASDAVYVDENGQIIPRSELLKQITPMPTGVSGNLSIGAYAATVHGDIATVIHTDNEQENYHGQALQAQYLTTETWQKSDGKWKLLLVHTYAVLHEPPSVKLTTAELDSYVGQYAAGDLKYVIRREGDALLGGREGRPASTLKAELRDVFFAPDQLRTRKIFERDSQGRVTGFFDRREGIDVVWKKVQ